MILYIDDQNAISAGQLQGFFREWKKPLTPAQHYETLCGSTYFIVAVDSETNLAVGYVTALSDGVNASFIPALEVLPEYKGNGIGTRLMEEILSKLHAIPNVDLMCNVETQPFYERFHMRKSNGMVLRK